MSATHPVLSARVTADVNGDIMCCRFSPNDKQVRYLPAGLRLLLQVPVAGLTFWFFVVWHGWLIHGAAGSVSTLERSSGCTCNWNEERRVGRSVDRGRRSQRIACHMLEVCCKEPGRLIMVCIC